MSTATLTIVEADRDALITALAAVIDNHCPKSWDGQRDSVHGVFCPTCTPARRLLAEIQRRRTA